ncbi:cysteine--tRNA ligase [bacterium]|jgi:cysteinyl-tRNA synthetase|nr:cysteine--tRNA ligase [bacterium]MBT4291302.1 cysteine--tRNA ligase [bacterium]
MTLHVYDHVTRSKKEFVPITPGKVGMYVCGLTVQDKPHVGHMFAFVACDMIRRYLEYLGYEVTHVQNFTDIDDKIINKAAEEGIGFREVADRNIDLYHQYAAELNLQPAHHYPLATENIDGIISYIEKLIEKDHAYAVGSDVYFKVRSFKEYGQLSGRNVDDMITGTRVELDEKKQDSLDFALWKGAADGEPSWESPWGAGRPGWHIECSVMSASILGDHFDFHGGGRDLLFPHHENERAQSCSCTGEKFVNYWLHNGLLFLGDKKMSKSDGNFFAMGEVLEKFRPEIIRFFLLNAHFRSQIDYSEERLKEAESALDRLKRTAVKLQEMVQVAEKRDLTEPEAGVLQAVISYRNRFFAAMDDDFNSAGAIGVLFSLSKELNQYYSSIGDNSPAAEVISESVAFFTEGIEILGLWRGGFAEMAKSVSSDIPEDIIALAAERDKAREEKNWARADELRDELQKKGYLVEDSSAGTVVKHL